MEKFNGFYYSENMGFFVVENGAVELLLGTEVHTVLLTNHWIGHIENYAVKLGEV